MGRWGVWLLALGLVGCPKAGGISTPPAMFIPPKQLITWRENVAINEVALLEIAVRQEWSPARSEGDGQAWTVTEYQDDGRGERVRQRFDVFYGPDGYGYLGVRDGDTLSAYQPPEVVLPTAALAGKSWSAVHVREGTSVDRQCELIPSEFCKGGVISVCDGVRGTTRTVVREFFCPGQGWVGYETLSVREGQTERRWTENVLRDPVLLIGQ